MEAIRYDSIHVEPGDSSSAVDLLHMLTSLSQYTSSYDVKIAANQAAAECSPCRTNHRNSIHPDQAWLHMPRHFRLIYPSPANCERGGGNSEVAWDLVQWHN